jgi:LPS O-antigen subunit length determinant protein (WzzB/FepE family)
VSSVSRIPSVAESDEIDLFALAESIWRQKLLILAVTALAGIVALIYVFSVTPQYRVASVLRPVPVKDLDALNRSTVYSLSPEAALLKVGAALDSYETRLAFYKANPSLFKELEDAGKSFEQNFEEFNQKSLRMTVTDSAKVSGLSSSVMLELDYPAKMDGVSVLNRFVSFAVDSERVRLVSDVKTILGNRIAEIEKSIDAARASYEIDKKAKIANLEEADALRRAQLQDELNALRQQLKAVRQDRIEALGEAIKIARSLGIVKPTTPSAMAEENSRMTTTVRTEVNNQQTPLYFMGTETLEAERSALQQRKSDEFTEPRIAGIFKELQLLQVNREVQLLNKRTNEDLFLSDVDALRKELVRLRAMRIDADGLQIVDIDRRAVTPSAPVKPQKAVIIVISCFLGIFLGCGIALVREFINHKRRARLGLAHSVNVMGQALPVPSAKGLPLD